MPENTVSRCIRMFLTSLEAAGRSKRTIDAYEFRLRIIDPEQLVTDISPEQIDEKIVRLRRSNKSAATVADYIQATKAFFRWCHKRGYIQNDQMDCKKSGCQETPQPTCHTTLRRSGVD